MARSFSGSTQYLSKSVAIATVMPISMGSWFNPTTSTGWAVMGIGSATASKTSLYQIWYQNNGQMVAEIIGAVDDATAQPAVTLVNGTWYYICAVFASATSRTMYVNNTAVSSVVSCTPTAADLNRTAIAACFYNGAIQTPSANAQMAFPAFWNVALSATDVASLVAGASPRIVRPQGLIGYARLTGGSSPEPDAVSSTGWTLTGAPTVAANPRIYGR